jgi:adenylate cyclase
MDLAWSAAAAAGALAAALGFAWRRRAGEAARLAGALEEATRDLQRLQTSFSRFAPQEIVERIASSGVATGGERKEVTALFADLVEYTALAERLEPSLLVRILNGYFERMSRAITHHRGYVSTFVGDGLLALFGAFEPNPWQSDDAVAAALEMRRELVVYNGELARDGLPALAFGVGLHRGVGVAGLVGSRDLMQYALVGGTINVAARVQTLTREHDIDILLTEQVRARLAPRFTLRPLPPAQLKGLAHPVSTYALEGLETETPGRAGA